MDLTPVSSNAITFGAFLQAGCQAFELPWGWSRATHSLMNLFSLSIRSALAGLLSVAAANAFAAPAEISADRIREDVRVLSSDAFEGRGPGEPAESKTLNYLTAQFKAAGLEPGAPGGGWLQDVSMMRFDRAPLAKVTINTPRGCCQSDRNSSPIDAAIAT